MQVRRASMGVLRLSVGWRVRSLWYQRRAPRDLTARLASSRWDLVRMQSAPSSRLLDGDGFAVHVDSA